MLEARKRLVILVSAIGLALPVGTTFGETERVLRDTAVTGRHADGRCLQAASVPVPIPPRPKAAAGDEETLYRLVNRFHIIRRSNGTGGVAEHLIEPLMRDMNYGFRDTPFRFVREPDVVYIDDDALYTDVSGFAEATPLSLWQRLHWTRCMTG